MIKMNFSRKDILLVFIALPINEKRDIISPIQLMKGMFLIKNELKMPDFYEFKPYLYGPCSFEIYSDLSNLLESSLISIVDTPFSWKCFRITAKGLEKADLIIKNLDNELIGKLNEIKKFVIKKTFLELLEYIYKKYPEYAKNTIINLKVFEK
jgi:uncharacterized protein YwgA